jgi:nitrite reductase (NO-forming)
MSADIKGGRTSMSTLQRLIRKVSAGFVLRGGHKLFSFVLLGVLLLGFQQSCTSNMSTSKQLPAPEKKVETATQTQQAPPVKAEQDPHAMAAQGNQQSPAEYTPNVTVTLKTVIAEGKLVFMGVGGALDGKINPALQVKTGDVVQVNLVNDDGAEHDIVLPDFNAESDRIVRKGASSVIVFRADKKGEFAYFCSVPGHRQAGMEGKLIVGAGAETAAIKGESIVQDPTSVVPALQREAPQTLRIDLESIEVVGRLADGTTYTYWTYNGKVPGPFLRARVGDTIEVHFKNHADSKMIHSVDFHSVTGPGGGAVLTQTPPGEERIFTFKAMNPGLYVYHCATPMVAHHITNGMYGLILVEPEKGLPPVDREFYVMQGEIYTQEKFGTHGDLEFSVEKLVSERPEYFVFNGAVGALTTEKPLKARVGETVRIYFGVGGPNFTSSFHVIGEIFDKVYDQGSTSNPLTDVQTTLVPPGGATWVEFKIDVPGRYILVDHALSRLEHGLVGFLLAEGPENPAVFHKGPVDNK